MMRKIVKHVLLSLGSIIVTFIFMSCSNIIQPSVPSSYQETINRFLLIKPSVQELPAHFLTPDSSKLDNDFNPNQYFTALKHLSLRPGYVLDFVYYLAGGGGEPILYVRSVNQKPYVDYEDFVSATGEQDLDQWRYGFINDIQADDSEEGYFELIVLRTMGAEFYQFGLASYNDSEIVGDQSGLNTLSAWPNIPNNVQQKARNINFQPIITMRSDTVQIKIILFSKWGGFSRETLIVDRKFPHKMISDQSEILVPFESDLQY